MSGVQCSPVQSYAYRKMMASICGTLVKSNSCKPENLKTSEKLLLGLGFKYEENLDMKQVRGVKIRLYITNEENFHEEGSESRVFCPCAGEEDKMY